LTFAPKVALVEDKCDV